MPKIKIGIHGSTGRMGIILKNLVENDNALQLGELYARNEKSSLDDLCTTSDIIIDFALGVALPNLLIKASEYKIPLVIASTGFDDVVLQQIKDTAKIIPIFYAANMSYGAHILAKLVRQAASFFGKEEFDALLIDQHHRYKLDSPSGTAKMLAQIINKQWYKDNELDYTKALNPIKFGNVTICSIKQGSIIGEHQVSFASLEETITLSHKVNSREVFARGAIKAAKWLFGQPAGFYEYDDIIDSK